jgi:hypothetical protein
MPKGSLPAPATQAEQIRQRLQVKKQEMLSHSGLGAVIVLRL